MIRTFNHEQSVGRKYVTITTAYHEQILSNVWMEAEIEYLTLPIHFIMAIILNKKFGIRNVTLEFEAAFLENWSLNALQLVRQHAYKSLGERYLIL